MKVDVHSHITPADLMGRAGKYGPERWTKDGYGYMRVGNHTSSVKINDDKIAKYGPNGDISLMSPLSMGTSDLRLADMNENGIDIMGVTIPPLWYLYWAEPDIGVPWALECNDSLANYCSGSDGRLFFEATLPLQDIEASVSEVDRAASLGAKAINLGGANIAGREVDDEALFPVYERIEAADLAIFLHPYPDHLVSEEEVPDKYNLSWISGYPSQEMTAFCRFILGGVLDQFPGLKIYIPHGGGFAPYQWGRLTKFAPHMPDVKATKPYDEYLDNFYFDILLHDQRERRFVVDFIGADHLVYGSNYGSQQDQASFSFADDIGLNAEEIEKVIAGNAIKLFHLDASAALAAQSS